MSLKPIERSIGDERAVRISWSQPGSKEAPRLDDVSATSLRIYDEEDKANLVETLDGEVRGFDPAAWFPIADANWSGTRWFQIVLTRGAEDEPFAELGKWTQS